MSIFSKDYWIKSNRKVIFPINHKVNQDNTWVIPLVVGLAFGLLIFFFAY